MVKAEDIPKVTNTLLGKLGLSNGTQRLAMNDGNTQSEFEIDWDKILQSIDSVGGETYTFNVDHSEENISTFYNLVIKFTPEGSPYKPFIMKYDLDSAFVPTFLSTGSLEDFVGVVTKIPLSSSNTSSGDYSINSGPENVRMVTSDPNCPPQTIIDNGDGNNSGGGPGSLPGPGTGGTVTYVTVQRCDYYLVKNYYNTLVDDVYSSTDFYYTMEENCYEYSYYSHTESPDGSNCDTGPGEIPIIQPEDRLLELNLALRQDSTLLINLSCRELAKWQEVGSHKPPSGVMNKIISLRANYPNLKAVFTGNFDMQTLKEAKGTVLNMDYFPVKIDQLPSGFTAEEFLQHIRTNLNSFIDTQYSSFSPYDAVNTGYDEAQVWNSNNPIGSILHIEIPMDEGSVICSDFSSDSWKFTTISAPYDWTHPVSGTREFGFTRNDDGSYEFYTRGVDRITQSINEILGAKATFKGADNLWLSLQEGIRQFVNANGGTSVVGDPIIGRPNYSDIVDFLAGKKTLSDLGCKN